MRKYKSLFVCMLVTTALMFTYTSYAQQSDITITLKLDTLLDRSTERRTIYHPLVMKCWENENDTSIIDSILYKCAIKNSVFYVLVKRESDKIEYTIPTEYNSSLGKAMSYTYSVDSLRKWNPKNAPKNAIIAMKYPFTDDKGNASDMELFLIPYQNGFKFKDQRMNDFALSFSTLKIRHTEFQDEVLKVYVNSCVNYDRSDIEITVMDKAGNMHRNSYLKNSKYKQVYCLGDTIPFDNINLRLDSLDKEWNFAYCTQIEKDMSSKNLFSDELFEKVKPYFSDNTSFLLIDFWGTWCGPCINGIPDLKTLYDSVKDRCSFLSVCFDQPGNFEKSEVILDKNNAKWGRLWDNQEKPQEALTLKLGVNTFPSYILINNKKEILFRDEGAEGWKELKDCIFKIVNDKDN